jgi:putative ABC transport system permease protein
MEAAFGQGPVNNAAVYLEAGLDTEAVIDGLKGRFAGVPLEMRSNRRLRAEVMSIFDQTFAVTRLLRAMSLLIAAAGITMTMLVIARERSSEIALYRALGASRPQIFRVTLGQGLAMSSVGLALGAAGGSALAAILIFVINKAWFGWTIAPHVPWLDLVRDGLIILAVATLASLYPAVRATRIPATDLSRDDL